MLSELTADTERNLLIAQDVAREVRESRGISLVLSDRRSTARTCRPCCATGSRPMPS